MRLVRARGSQKVHAVVQTSADGRQLCVSAWHHDPIDPSRLPYWGLRRWVSSDQVVGDVSEDDGRVHGARAAMQRGEMP